MHLGLTKLICNAHKYLLRAAGGGACRRDVVSDTQLLIRVRKEADQVLAVQAVLAAQRAVAAGVQVALEHAMAVGAGVAALADALCTPRGVIRGAERHTRDAGVSARLLAGCVKAQSVKA